MQTVREPDVRVEERALAPYLVAGAVFAVLIAVLHDASATHGTDDPAIYANMARHPGELVTFSPFAYRIAVPWTVGLLPGSPLLWFPVVTWASLTAAVGMFHTYLRQWFTVHQAWLGCFLLSTSAGVVLTWRAPYTLDAPALALAVGGLLLISRSRWLEVVLLIAVGVWVRETALFLVLPAVVAARHDRRAVAALLTVPALSCFLLHHIYATAPATPVSMTDPDVWRMIVAWRVDHDGSFPLALFLATAGSLGFVWVAAWRGYRTAPRFLAETVIYVAPCVATLLVAGDWQRMLSFAAPAVIPLALNGNRRLLIGGGLVVPFYWLT